ncbi:MAG: type I-G CRISPR-associated protein Csb2 [Phycisphaerales bacterium]
MMPAIQTGFAIGVRYLTGYAAAAAPTGEVEWPPHPARLFMAMVAACHEAGGDAGELAALRWLEQQDPPQIVASECDVRQTVTVFVPPNDFTAKDPNILPQWRTKRRPRTFVRACVHHEQVHFKWQVQAEHAEALAAVCEKVSRLGHSSSLVQVWLQLDPVEADGREQYRRSDQGAFRFRTINDGSLAYLISVYRKDDVEDHLRLDERIVGAKSKANKQMLLDEYEQRFGRAWMKNTPPQRLRPEMSRALAYEQVSEQATVRHGCFDPSLIMFSLSPKESRYRRLAAESGPRVCEVFRKAIQKYAPDDLPLVNGHTADGAALQSPHMAVMPLPFVGLRHADGHLLGVAAVLPPCGEYASVEDRKTVIAAIRKVDHLNLGELGVWEARAVEFDEQRKSLQPDGWTAVSGGAMCWATVTPIALDRHAKSKDPIEQQDEIAEMIRQACEAIGLPKPVRVVPFPVSAFGGLPDAGRYPRLARKDGSKRRQTHAMLWFGEPVVGPMLLGAGRFRGWGVCRPHESGVR